VDWVFDLRTAIVLGALVTWLTGGLLLLSWTSLPRAVRPSLRWWLAGLVLHPAGFLLVSLRPVLPPSLGVVLANALLAVAFACMVIALRSFYGLPQRRARLYGLAASMALASLCFTWLLPNLQARQSLEALLLALLLAHSASAVFRSDGPPGLVARLTGALFALAGGTMLAFGTNQLLGFAPASVDFQPTWLNIASAGVLLLLPVLATVGFLLMCTERSQEELERTARIDFLTGIYNRRAIEDLATRAISASRRHGIPLAIMLVDVDHFKRINDQFGHEIGDQALIETVRRMRQIMRAEDLVGRQGGEEFVAVMPSTDGIAAVAAAERVRAAGGDPAPRTLEALRAGAP
jgi:GGDEF domain-containing protein